MKRALVVFLVLPALVGCSAAVQQQEPQGSNDQGPIYGGTLMLSGGGFHLDPHQSNTANTFTITSQVYNWLLRPKPGEYAMNTLIGDLAEKWEPSTDGKIWTLSLRKGVKWHDGSDFTSADVKASFDRVMSPPEGMVSPRKAQFSPIQEIEARDANTVVFRVGQPWPEILYALADAQHPMLPAKIIKSDPKFFLDNMMGTGPFKVQNYRKNDIIELVRNDAYWDKGKPYLDGITFTYISDPATTFAALQTGQLTGPAGITPARVPSMRSGENAEKFVIWEKPQSTRVTLTFGTHRQTPFSDVKVRQAVNLALDRSAMCSIDKLQCQFGGGGFMMGDTPWYLPDWDKQPFNQGTLAERRTKAQALLAEAGYPNGFSVEIKTRNLEFYEASALWAIDQMKTIKITGTMRNNETAKYYEYLESGNFDASSDYWASTWPTPDDLLNKYLVPGGGQNYSKYDNPQITQLLRRQSQTPDQNDRIRLVNETERLLWQDLPQIPMGWYYTPTAHWNYVRDYYKGVSHYNASYYSDIWLDARYPGTRKPRS